MKFSKKSQYGLKAMFYLAKAYDDEKRFCSLKEISGNEKISFSYLEKILSKLEKGKLLRSKKGFTGGYRLYNHPKNVNVGDIIRCLEGSINVDNCYNHGKRCPKTKTCEAFSVWRKVKRSLEDTLNSMTLLVLIKK